MKALSLLLCLLSSSMFCDQKEPKCDIRKYLLGTWVYQVSRSYNNVEVKVETGTPLLAYKIKFANCNDSIALKRMPATVQNTRRQNELRNLSSSWYRSDGTLIDTYFPVALTVGSSGMCSVEIINYGNLYKGDCYIEVYSDDTLIISNGKVYIVDSIQYSSLRHIYTRQR